MSVFLVYCPHRSKSLGILGLSGLSPNSLISECKDFLKKTNNYNNNNNNQFFLVFFKAKTIILIVLIMVWLDFVWIQVCITVKW